MNNPNKWQGLLGLAKRAGQLTIGFDASVGAITKSESRLLLIAADTSPKTAKECRYAAQNSPNSRRITVRDLPLGKADLSALIGMAKPVGVVAVCDKGLAAAIVKSLDEAAALPNPALDT